jgi:hypothetical protein
MLAASKSLALLTAPCDDPLSRIAATILGPVTIGEGAVIDGNVCLTDDVPAGARVTQGRPERDLFADGAGI